MKAKEHKKLPFQNEIIFKKLKTLVKIMKEENFFTFSALETNENIGCFNDFEWTAFAKSWNELGIDNHMMDNGKYRYRRYATFSLLPSSCIWFQEPDQPHYQSLNYNNLNGGTNRYFLPFNKETVESDIFNKIMNFCCNLFSELKPLASWHIEAHQFRICASNMSCASPTPEGIHRDGVDFVFMLFVGRENVFGGETGVYDLNKNLIRSFTLSPPLKLLLLMIKIYFMESHQSTIKIKKKQVIETCLLSLLKKRKYK